MSRQHLPKLFLMGIIVALAACQPAVSPTVTPEPTDAPVEAAGVIVIGDISDDPAKKIARFQPLVDYLAANLSDFDIGVGEVRIAPDMETMIEWMQAGEIDLYFDSLYPAMIVSDASGAQPILRRWKNGNDEYHSVFFVRADSEFTDLVDLQGQLIAMQEAGSSSGYMLPMAYLVEEGFNLVEADDVEEDVDADVIGYIFSGDDENTIQWVVSGRVAAGVTDNQNYVEIPEETREGLVILAETQPIPRQVVVAGPDMDDDLLAAIRDLLVGLDEAEEGVEILETAKTSQFDEFPQGAETALEEMRVMYEAVQNR